ncbi:MAG: molybdopterin-dependent oxidoreductase, partial [Planctomycetota bacterium]
MSITRRDFVKLSAAVPVGSFCITLGAGAPAEAGAKRRAPEVSYGKKIRKRSAKKGVCGICPVGCGITTYASAENIAHVEGDSRNPINRGSVCSRLLALSFLNRSRARVGLVVAEKQFDEHGKPMERSADPWEDKIRHRKGGAPDWDEAGNAMRLDATISAIASKVIATRGSGQTCTSIGFIGGPGMTNEEAYAATKFCRGLGMLYVDNPARNGYLPALKALGETYGRMAPTNHPTDIANSKCVLVIGANPAVTHPVLMKHIHDAQLRGAKLIVVDPRSTETTSKADLHIRIMPGTDLAFLGGMIYSMVRGLDPSLRIGGEKPPTYILKEYLKNYTDAFFRVDKDFQTVKKEGVFSGYSGTTRQYDRSTWRYQFDNEGRVKQDERETDPVIALSRLVENFSQFKDARVADICGINSKDLETVINAYRRTVAPDSAGAIVMGNGVLCTTNGPQATRAAAILQLLLGNIGVAGGGIYPLADFGNAQGVIDNGLVADFLPGHLPYPTEQDSTIGDYVNNHLITTKEPRAKNYWQRMQDYLTNLLAAWYGPEVDAEQAFAYLPKRNENTNYGYNGIFEAIESGKIKGLIVFGDNPAVSAPSADRVKKALGKLDWLVVLDMVKSETATFWKEVSGAGTEVYLLNSASIMEKDGSFTNMGRWVQWTHKGITPANVGRTIRSDLHILSMLRGAMLNQAPESFSKLKWDYGNAVTALVAKEINGFDSNNRQLRSITDIKNSGTVCGNWLYAGYCSGEIDMEGGFIVPPPCQARDNTQTREQIAAALYPKYAWRWPEQVHVLYNRASLESRGASWNGKRRLLTYTSMADGSPKWSLDLD